MSSFSRVSSPVVSSGSIMYSGHSSDKVRNTLNAIDASSAVMPLGMDVRASNNPREPIDNNSHGRRSPFQKYTKKEQQQNKNNNYAYDNEYSQRALPVSNLVLTIYDALIKSSQSNNVHNFSYQGTTASKNTRERGAKTYNTSINSINKFVLPRGKTTFLDVKL